MLLLAPGRLSMTTAGRVDPTTADPAAARRCRARCRAENRRECAPAASDRLARKQSETAGSPAAPAARCKKLSAGKFHGLPLCNVGDATLHSALILAARITFAHLAVSDLITTANSSGE